jgi:hypothetical protein
MISPEEPGRLLNDVFFTLESSGQAFGADTWLRNNPLLGGLEFCKYWSRHYEPAFVGSTVSSNVRCYVVSLAICARR